MAPTATHHHHPSVTHQPECEDAPMMNAITSPATLFNPTLYSGQNAFSKHTYRPTQTNSIAKHAGNALTTGALLYFPIKWLANAFHIKAPGFLATVLGLFGFNTLLKPLMGHQFQHATVPAYSRSASRLNLAA